MKEPGVPWGNVMFANGLLYTTSFMGGKMRCGKYNCGTIFSVNPATGAAKVVLNFGRTTDALLPEAGVVFDGGSFFGTTDYGGPLGFGTVFKFRP